MKAVQLSEAAVVDRGSLHAFMALNGVVHKRKEYFLLECPTAYPS